MKMSFLCPIGEKTIALEETRFELANRYIHKKNPALAKWLWSKRSISYERYWEIALAGLRRGVHWTDVKGMDLSDGTEVKTITITIEKDGSQTCTIGNMKNKKGDLVVVVYHAQINDFYFYLIPPKAVQSNMIDTGRGTLRMSFPRYAMPTGWQTKYRVSFEKMICG